MAGPAPRVSAVTWLVPHYPWADDEISGIFHRTQARALERLGIRVSVSAPVPWVPPLLPVLRTRWRLYADAPRGQRDGTIEIRRPRYLSLPGEPLWAHPERLLAGAALRDASIWRAVPLLHAHFAVPHGLAALEIHRRTGLPYVITVHGYDLNTWPDARPGGRRALVAALRGAAAIVAVSDALADRVKEISGCDAVSLPLGVDVSGLAALRLSRSDARRRFGLPEDRVVALFLSRLAPHKGVREFVDAILDGDGDVLGVVAGDGDLAGYRADEGRASGRLRYVGPQGRPGVVELLCAADMIVLPSRSEGLPTVLVEAGAIGTPVIASRVGGIPQLLGADRGTLLENPEVTAIREAIRSVVSQPAEAAVAARRLQAHVAENFDVDRNALRLVDLYAAAIRGGRAGPRVAPGA
jgi:teichuronic acid biosynthesis glycosyltransferase TuaC